MAPLPLSFAYLGVLLALLRFWLFGANFSTCFKSVPRTPVKREIGGAELSRVMPLFREVDYLDFEFFNNIWTNGQNSDFEIQEGGWILIVILRER